METQIDYRDRIRRVMMFIDEKLGERLKLKEVARVACFSEYHFHRIFVAYVGMTLQEYISYRRLSKAAEFLLRSSMRITDIAFEVGFESSAAFTTAFKKLFQVNPNLFRKTQGEGYHLRSTGFFSPLGIIDTAQVQRQLRFDRVHYEVKTVPEMNLLSITKKGFSYGCFFKAAQDGFTGLYDYIELHGLQKNIGNRVSIFPELPYSMNDPCAIIHCGFSIKGKILPEKPFKLLTMESGKYAVFHYKGPYEFAYQMWMMAYNKCFLTGQEQIRDVPPFELYLNSPRDTPPEELLIEMHIPIQ
jgi:AraC family transcriptional regulator